MSVMTSISEETDWKFVAVECQRKLNLIAGELNLWKKNCLCSDCTSLAADIIKKFNLDSESVGNPKPEYVELRQKLDAITGLVARLKFSGLQSRDALIDELSKLLSDFGLSFNIFGAFVCL